MQPSQEALDDLVKQIVEKVHPLQVILFGSAARHGLSVANDIDLLIVMPDGTHRRETSHSLYRNLTGKGVPFDLVITTPSILHEHQDNIGLIYKSILEEGKVVYAA